MLGVAAVAGVDVGACVAVVVVVAVAVAVVVVAGVVIVFVSVAGAVGAAAASVSTTINLACSGGYELTWTSVARRKASLGKEPDPNKSNKTTQAPRLSLQHPSVLSQDGF